MNADTGLAARELSYAEAIREAMDISLAEDRSVVLMGEDIGVYGGAFQVTGDLIERYGSDRRLLASAFRSCTAAATLSRTRRAQSRRRTRQARCALAGARGGRPTTPMAPCSCAAASGSAGATYPSVGRSGRPCP